MLFAAPILSFRLVRHKQLSTSKLASHETSEVESVANTQTAQVRPIAVGDLVRVRENVEKPRYGWGPKVDRIAAGVVAALGSGTKVYVDYPEQAGWTADRSELEREDESSFAFGNLGDGLCPFGTRFATREECGQAAASFFGDPTIGTIAGGRPLHCSYARQADGIVYNGGSIFSGQPRGDTRPLCVRVCFPFCPTSAPPAPPMPSPTAPPQAAPPAAFAVGDSVRVKASVDTPRYGWALVDGTSVGVVAALGSGTKAYVDYPQQSGWTADSSEMEKAR